MNMQAEETAKAGSVGNVGVKALSTPRPRTRDPTDILGRLHAVGKL